MNQLSQRELQRLSEQIYAHCGIQIRSDKFPLLQSRVTKLMRRKQIESTTQLFHLLDSERDDRTFTDLIDFVSTNVTRFFRETQHFDFLRNTFIPDFILSKKSGLRVWCAACSTGQEPYSILMTLVQTLPESVIANLEFLATDISTRVLQTAQIASYSADQVSMIPRDLQTLFFEKCEPETLTVKSQYRSMIKFRHFNLMESFPFRKPFDLIFCRNVMIYFDSATVGNVVNKMKSALNQGGYLIVGLSESIPKGDSQLKFMGSSIYKKV